MEIMLPLVYVLLLVVSIFFVVSPTSSIELISLKPSPI